MSDIERGLVARYVVRVLERGDLPIRATRYILYWLNERANMLSLPLPKALAKAVGNIYASGFDPVDLERVFRHHRQRIIADLRRAAEQTPRPEPLATNLDHLVREFGLPRASWKVMGLLACYTRYEQVQFLCDNVAEVVGPMVRAIAVMVGEPPRAIEQLMAPAGDLAASGLLQLRDEADDTLGFRGRFSIPSRVNGCLDQSFASFAEMRHAFLGEVLTSPITLGDYDHVAADRDLIANVLRGAVRERAKGVNILLYGPPGSGKTELTKVAAKAAGVTLHGAGDEARAGGETDRAARLANLIFATKLLIGSESTALLFDEMEDIAWQLIRRGGSKVFLNRLLETNPVPVLWTSNNLREIDSALLRRMTLAIELKQPPARQRERILRRLSKRVGVPLSERDVQALAHRVDATPAILENALKAARYAGQGSEAVERAALGVLRAMSGASVPRSPAVPEFDLKLAAADQDLRLLAQRLASSSNRAFSLCLSGPPGTGKSAFGRYLAKRLGLDVIHKRASDLLGAYVGESEKRIAEAFEEARDAGALLIFDEAESFLFDRRDAVRSWEITQVNEMLTWMEDHPLPVCCTTNLMERFDVASLRRFTFHVRLTFLDRVALKHAYRVFFSLGKVPEAGLDFTNLTPGDFAQARKQADVLGCRDNVGRIIELLDMASRTKPGTMSAIGFGH